MQTRRLVRSGQGVEEPVMPDAVTLPVLDLPEWAEATLQVLSLGAFTPRSAERRALEAAARVDLPATD